MEMIDGWDGTWITNISQKIYALSTEDKIVVGAFGCTMNYA